MTQFEFTFAKIESHYAATLSAGYEILTCADYVREKPRLSGRKILVNRIDIDFSVRKAERLGNIFEKLNIKGTFFLRLHAPEYNPFSFENYKVIKTLINQGHEIGYHSEVIDQSVIWNEDAIECLSRDIEVINRIFGIKVVGVASHGGMTGLNNLDFWKERRAKDLGLLYEAYDHDPSFNLFQEAFYISDSEWTRWKCYNKGKLVQDDRRTLSEHLVDKHPLIYLLIHPDTYYERHFYE